MVTALIIDDEENNRDVLRTLLAKNCPDINLIGEAENADEAFLKITSLKPQLVFLDIMMPGKSGFDLLKMFHEINFEVIFVTAYDTYAISAFEFNALDYILKPISVAKLIRAVEKGVQKIQSNISDESILHFIQTLSDKNELVSRFSVHNHDKVIFIEVSDISYIEAKEDNTTLTLFNNAHYYSSKDLVKYESVLREAGNFIRINKSVIINTHFIKGYSKGEPCIIDLKTGQCFEVSRRRKAEILKKLKNI